MRYVSSFFSPNLVSYFPFLFSRFVIECPATRLQLHKQSKVRIVVAHKAYIFTARACQCTSVEYKNKGCLQRYEL